MSRSSLALNKQLRMEYNSGWDACKNSRVKRYGTAMIEAYLNCDPAAYPYINGAAAQSDSGIKIYPESRGLSMPPAGCP